MKHSVARRLSWRRPSFNCRRSKSCCSWGSPDKLPRDVFFFCLAFFWWMVLRFFRWATVISGYAPRVLMLLRLICWWSDHHGPAGGLPTTPPPPPPAFGGTEVSSVGPAPLLGLQHGLGRVDALLHLHDLVGGWGGAPPAGLRCGGAG